MPVIGVADNFFEIGGSSLLAQRVIALLRKNLNTEIPLIKIFQYPTIAELSEYLSENTEDEDAFILETTEDKKSSKDIAIIGMSGRFPEADTLEALWDIPKSR